MKTKFRILPVAVAVAASMSPLSLQVYAQSGLEEVIVTAQRRAQSMQDVPVAVSAYDADMVEKARIVDVGDIVTATPSLSYTPFSQVDPQLFIRGIGSSDDGAGGDPSVLVFQDDIVFSRASGQAMNMFDVQRIEVMRGPQGTLFGKNAVGGAIHIITKDPHDAFGGSLSVTPVGDHSRFETQGAVNAPLNDNWQARLAFATKEVEGYNKSLTTGRRVDGEDNNSARFKLRYSSTDTFDAMFTYNWSRDDIYGNTRKPIPNGNFSSNNGAVDVHPDPRKRQPDDDGYLERDVESFDLKLNWQIGPGTLSSITAWRTVDVDWFQELGGLRTPPGRLKTQNLWRDEAEQFTQEARYTFDLFDNRLHGVAGFFYLDETIDREEEFRRTFFLVPGNPPGQTPSVSNPVFIQDNETTSVAVFGQATYDITEALRLTVGSRWTRDEKDIDLAVSDLSGGSLPSLAPALETYAVSNSESWEEVTSSASLDYDLTDDALIYLRVAEGYKAGGFQTAPSTANAATVSYEPELALTFEAGIKAEWFDRRLRTNLAVFSNDYEDLQVLQLVEAVPGDVSTLVLVTDNAADAEIQGVEFEFLAVVTEHFTIGGSYSKIDAEFEDYITNTGEDLSGFELRRTPEDSSSLYFEYGLPVGSGNVMLRGEYLYKGDQYFENDNREVSLESSYGLFNASLRYTSLDEKWSVSLWGKNLDDEIYRSNSISVADSGFSRIGPPRTWGLTFKYNFGEQ